VVLEGEVAVPLPSAEEWRAAQALRKTKRNLEVRQRKLSLLLRRGCDRFRRDEKAQVELRRVARLCVRLGVRLRPELEDEVVGRVMAS